MLCYKSNLHIKIKNQKLKEKLIMIRQKLLHPLGRLLAITTALVMFTMASFVVNPRTEAAMVTSRSIFMQSSTASASTTYSVSFTMATAHTSPTFKGLVIEFCEESPIIGSTTCTKPTGLSVGAAPTYDNFQIDGGAEITDWTADELNSERTFILYDATGDSADASDVITLDITSMTNPSTANDTFYARIYTYTDSGGATGYTLANPDAGATHVDDGGISLSTANPIVITSKVQEYIDFCVYTGTCGTSAIAIALGNAADGVLDTAHVYSDITAQFDITTNAASGAAVVLKGSTLESGANDIDPIGDTKAASSTGTEQFGMCLWQSTGSGLNLTNNTYNDTNCNTVTTGEDLTGSAEFGLDTTSTESSSGDTLGTKAAGSESTATLAFMANIAVTTNPGIYTTTLQLIATGTY
jgi:hypothetical protein